MKRFTQLAGIVTLALCAATSAHAQTKLTLGHGAALDNPRHLASVAFAKRVAELTNNDIQIQVAGSAQLGDDQALLTGNRTGSIQMSANSQGQVSSVVPEINAIGMPFLFDSPEHAWKVIDDPKVFDILKARKAYFRSWDHQLMQEAYPFTVKPKGQAKDKWDFLKFGDAVPAANQPLDLLATTKEQNTCKM